MTVFQCGRFRFELDNPGSRPLVMGILNITPDSFSDGGKYLPLPAALKHAEQMMAAGVDIIDIGGESTRPGSESISHQEEIDRILPVVEALKDCGKPLSIDTSKPETMKAVLEAGADMINDICGFQEEASKQAVSDGTCGLCIMHMQGNPKTMQEKPHYQDVVEEVAGFLKRQVTELVAYGVARDRMVIDPGFGFGKTKEDNIQLLRNIAGLKETLGLPLLAGLSRKTLIGQITGKPVEKRLAGNLAIALAAVQNGAAILRVHDVDETIDALKIWQAVHY
ncbi:MAG: dihydropteroate synthase [Oxalobacter sp.]|nr:dihydropteroate synthase [Oxalobacter sp.]